MEPEGWMPMAEQVTIPTSGVEASLDELARNYVFRNRDEVIEFVSNHGAVASILLQAVGPLKVSFGDDVLLHLEAVSEEDGTSSLFAIAIWSGRAGEAESALACFDEQWWLNQPPQRGLTFTYELA
jgi:hypothetical protein